MAKKIIISFLIGFTLVSSVFAASPPVRIKDIAHVLEARDNPIMGFGLVVGLKNTGDSSRTEFTKQALTNMLSRMGIAPQEGDFKSRNVAAVIVTAKLPPFLKPGQKIDVTVSSVGDANSIKGGILLLTPLHGTDEKIYAIAQGSVVVGHLGVEGTHSSAFVRKPSTVGRIAGGGIVEKEVPVTVSSDFVAIVLDKPDFTTASRVVSSLQKSGVNAEAKDAATIIATLPTAREAALRGESVEPRVAFVSRIENVTVVPDSVAKIVINERNGIIVIGENVRIAPVAVAYEGINVTIANMATYSRSSADDGSLVQVDAYSEFTPRVRESGADKGITAASGGASLADLVRALRAIGARPKDLIEILQAIKAAGALSAEIEII
ncbi:flagellar basal body P-ring protein FlgI [Candidatus Margulisiibacteriota bacterium]